MMDAIAGKRSTLPIIVGGVPRSGTTLLRRLLNGHSRIHCGPEIKFFDDFYGCYQCDDLKNLRFFATARKCLGDQEELLDIFGLGFVELHKRAALEAGKTRWADKNPSNALFLEQWRRIAPEGFLFLHAVRNPLDTIASLKEMDFHRTIPRDLAGRIATYKAHTTGALRFREQCPERYRVVLYEDFVRDTERSLKALMAWLGEESESQQLEVGAAKHGTGIEDPKIAGSAGVHGGSVGRWQGTLTEREAREVVRATSDLWRVFDPELVWLQGSDLETTSRRWGLWRDGLGGQVFGHLKGLLGRGS